MNFSSPNQALTPIPESGRVFGWHEHASLWFSLGVGLLVMQVGAYLVPSVGTRDAVIAIVCGSIVGAGLLAWVARTGCRSGLSSAGLIHRTYGSHFARLPVILNIVQLLGWTTFEMVIMREGTTAIARQAFGLELGGTMGVIVVTLFWGGILLGLLAGSMITLVRKFIARFALPLVILSLLWLSWQFLVLLNEQGIGAVWNQSGNGQMGLFSAMDLVIAMPISWLPLVADYARHGRSTKGALGGTWLGYAIANIWCYSLGVIIVSVAEPDAGLVNALLLAQGGLVALGLIMVDELDNAYGDLYSGSVSTHSLLPKWSIRRWGMTLAVISMIFATVLPIHTLEPFLLMLSSIFVPLYGVILGRHGVGSGAIADNGKRADWSAAAIWILGVVCYHSVGQWAPGLGSALPALAFTFLLAFSSRHAGRQAVA
jgi:putative hydroxymethylpyrimidine transporter CytX